MPEDLSGGWGLIWWDGKRLNDVVVPAGNFWPAYENADMGWRKFRQRSDVEAERAIPFSLARKERA